MHYGDHDEVKDAVWYDVSDHQTGNIKFRQLNRRSKFKNFIRFITFILIAAFTGGITANYVVEKKYSKFIGNRSDITNKNNNARNYTIDIPKNDINRVAETIGPAVVGITNSARGFFSEIEQGSGSGIIFDSDGYIVTNYHVIEGASRIQVKLANGSKVLYAKVIGADPNSDLAVIKVDGANLPTAKFGNSSNVRVGDTAIAIGNPLGVEFAGSVTAGIVSALNRRIRLGNTIYKVLQTDAAINPGNSGGALCNAAGEVIGINSLKMGSAQDAEGMGFAIAINEANEIVKQLMEYGRVARPRLGIVGGTAISKDGSETKGVYISDVVRDSGAYRAGIRPTDIIIEVDGNKITNFDELSKIVEQHKIGDFISCKILRAGKIVETEVELLDIEF